jgi:predicted O-linked N-acetylglucosamine transferase (SPINDLY family)
LLAEGGRAVRDIRLLVRDSLLLMTGICVALAVSAQDLQRGFKNYQDILGGRKKIEQLSSQERSEVLQVHRILQAKRAEAGKSAECESALERARSAASELADYSRRLRNCAEAADFSDDCSTEFRRARNAHSDYESAVSSVNSYCR